MSNNKRKLIIDGKNISQQAISVDQIEVEFVGADGLNVSNLPEKIFMKNSVKKHKKKIARLSDESGKKAQNVLLLKAISSPVISSRVVSSGSFCCVP
jgi:hypothetical protein